tara:strand:- start:995 stop:2251 length:1257 start_codon:yes stop_codon:yes gene_type:complete
MLLTLMAVAIAEEARQLAEHSRQRPHIMRADHLIRPLPRCSDEPLAAPITCGTEQQRFMDGHEVRHGASYRRMLPLCRGLMMIQSGTCAQLGNASFLREVVQTTGVTYDMRKQDLYGEAWKYMIRSSNGLRIGLWQDPSQFAAAMLYHGASRHEIANYVEVGCYTGWTGLVLVTYLQRVGHRTRGYLIDLTAQPMTLLLYTGLLKGRNLTFVERKEVPINKMDMVATYPELGGGRGSRNRAFDLCFIDAQHSYLGVLEDYSEFAPHCRNAMFHDIQCARRRRISASRPTSSDLAAPTPVLGLTARDRDMSTWHLGNWSGGVPAFWANLGEAVEPHRLTSITFQISSAQPVFGIGILRPSANSSAEPDVPLAAWPSWAQTRQLMRENSKETLTRAFCGRASPPSNWARSCSMLDAAKYR